MRPRFLVTPPGDETPESWLTRHDLTPKILPVWPESQRMALVCVEEIYGSEEALAFVITSRAELDAAASPSTTSLRRLFFQVPKFELLQDSICLGLTAESWEK